MTAHLSPDALRLSAIRARLAAIAPGDWRRAADADGEFLEVRTVEGELLPVARFHAGATLDEILFAVDAPDTVRFLLSLLERAAKRVRALERLSSPPAGGRGGAPGGRDGEGVLADRSKESPSPSASRAGRVAGLARPTDPLPPSGGEDRRSARRDHAAEVAMIVARPAFKRWLAEVHGLEQPLSDERCTGKLRSLLGITSRRELNDDRAARARWKALRADFKVWRDRPEAGR